MLIRSTHEEKATYSTHKNTLSMLCNYVKTLSQYTVILAASDEKVIRFLFEHITAVQVGP